MTCNSSPVSCNRQPFLSDSSCDRGNVDIHQFDDLPFCDPINPTVPDIPPEVVDTPLNLPIPPACACIHVDYDIGFKYTKEREFSASTSFSAKSDCCEGLYVSRINLQVPCPVISSSRNYRLRVVARYGKSSASPTSYFETDNSSCTFRPLSATLNVNVPCPVSSAGPYRLQVKAKYGKGSASPTSYFVNDPESCAIKPLSATLNVNVPCPVSSAGPYRLQVKAKYGKGSASPTSYFVNDPESCAIKPLSATLNVNVPCPIEGSSKTYKMRVKAKYLKRKDFSSASSVSFLRADVSSCALNFSVNSSELKVNIPCPITQRGDTPLFCIEFDKRQGIPKEVIALGWPRLDNWGRFKAVLYRSDGTSKIIAEYGPEDLIAGFDDLQKYWGLYGEIPGVGHRRFAVYDQVWGKAITFTTADTEVDEGIIRLYGWYNYGDEHGWAWAGDNQVLINATAPLVWCVTMPKIAELPCGISIAEKVPGGYEYYGTNDLEFAMSGSEITAYVVKILPGGTVKVVALASFEQGYRGIWRATDGLFYSTGIGRFLSGKEEMASVHLTVFDKANDEADEDGGKLYMSVKYGACGGNGAVAELAKVDDDTCEMKFQTPSISLNIPCPVPPDSNSGSSAEWKRSYKLKIRARYAKGQAPATSYLEVDDMSCVINPLSTIAPSSKSYSWMDPEFPDGFYEPHTVAMNVNIPCPVRSRRRMLGKLSEAEKKYPGEIKISGDAKFRYQKYISSRKVDPSTGEVSPWSAWELVEDTVSSAMISFDGNKWTATASGLVFIEFDDDGNPTSFTESKDQETTYRKTKEVYQVSENKGAWLDSGNATLEDMPYLYFDTNIEQNAYLPNGINIKKKIGNDTTLLGNSELFFQRDGDTITAYDNGGSTLGTPVATFTLDKDGRFHASEGSFDIDGDSASNATLIAFDSGDSAKIEEGGKMFVGVAYGNGPNGRAAKFVQTDESNCSTQFLSPVFNLSIPCPIRVKKTDSSSDSSSQYVTKGPIKLSVRWGRNPSVDSSSSSSSSGTAIGWVKNECGVELNNKTEIDIPFPPGPFQIVGKKIKYRYIIVGRTLIEDNSDSAELACFDNPQNGMNIYAKVSVSDCARTLSLVYGGGEGDSFAPENTLADTYRLIYAYRDNMWIDCRWMPVIMAAE